MRPHSRALVQEVGAIIENDTLSIEKAYWVHWRSKVNFPCDAKRIYFGHETCARLLPSADEARGLIARSAKQNIPVTLVTPFLTENYLELTMELIDQMVKEINELEVVCSDWGLLERISNRDRIKPVVGRLLAGQHTDPRIERIFKPDIKRNKEKMAIHADGTRCTIKRKKPAEALTSALCGCWVDKDNVIEMLQKFGVNRCELNNIKQGIELKPVEAWRYSLYIPDVLLAVIRGCPGVGEDFNDMHKCEDCSWDVDGEPNRRMQWVNEHANLILFRVGAGIYYNSLRLPSNLTSLPIDRIVIRSSL